MSTKKQDDKKADENRKEQQEQFTQDAKALSSRTHMAQPHAGETGPAQGHDPAVAIPEPVESDQGVAVEDEPITGPAQTPVHVVTTPEPTDEPAPKAKRHPKMDDAHVDAVAAIVKQAHETMGTAHHTDGFGRSWTAQYGPINNQAAITLQVGRGDETHQTVLATSGMASDEPEHLRKAVKAASEQVK